MPSADDYTWTRASGATRRAWRARWVGADGRPMAKRGFPRERDALAYARDQEAGAAHGVQLGERHQPRPELTVEQWGAEWLATCVVRPSTFALYGYCLKRINADLGGRPLASLRPSELAAWRKAMGARYAASTADSTAAILAMMLRTAVQDGLLPKSPWQPKRQDRAAAGVVEPDGLLTLEQVRAWGRAMPEVVCEMPTVAAMTGLRQGELLGLRLANVSFMRRRIMVVEQMVTPPGAGEPTWGPPKTAAGHRAVPLSQPVAEALARHLERFPAVDGEPIFRTVTGRRWRRATFGAVWREARRTAGLPEWAHWHGLRDVAASGLVRAGVDIKTIMSVMGHTSSEETLRVYAKLWDDSQDNARQALDRLWSDSGTEVAAPVGELGVVPRA